MISSSLNVPQILEDSTLELPLEGERYTEVYTVQGPVGESDQ